jgi:hypothetical protein
MKELVVAKNLFLKDPRVKIDKENNFIITKEHFDRVSHDLTLMIKCVFNNKFRNKIFFLEKNMANILLMRFYMKIK